MSKRTIVIEIEDNRIQSCQVEEEGKKLDMCLGEACCYLLDYTDIIQITSSYEDEMARACAKAKAENEFLYHRVTQSLFDEVFEQLTPPMIIKMYIADPILKLVDKIDSMDCSKSLFIHLLKRYIVKPTKVFLLRFVFGKENAKRIEEVIREAKEKYLNT